MVNTKMIGNKIADARRKINISQAQLAERLFISSQAVGKWERGESMPDITTFIRLAELLGVDLNYFSESFKSLATDMISTESVVKPSDDLTAEKRNKTPNWDMSHGNWVDADFSGLKNLHEKFSSSNMHECKFMGSDLSRLLLKSNNVNSCDFSGSDLSNCHFVSSNLVRNLFKKCSLKETEFLESYIYQCDFTDADFTEVVIKSGGLAKNIIANAVWKHTSFIDAQITDMVFTGTLEDCCFENCAFARVTFQNSMLINNFFKNNKRLNRIRFIDCQADRITYAFLKNGKADLTGITLLTNDEGGNE